MIVISWSSILWYNGIMMYNVLFIGFCLSKQAVLGCWYLPWPCLYKGKAFHPYRWSPASERAMPERLLHQPELCFVICHSFIFIRYLRSWLWMKCQFHGGQHGAYKSNWWICEGFLQPAMYHDTSKRTVRSVMTPRNEDSKKKTQILRFGFAHLVSQSVNVPAWHCTTTSLCEASGFWRAQNMLR